MLDLYAELRRIAEALDVAHIPYALVGGLAVSIYTTPRATEDIDLLIARDDLDRATGALRSLGFQPAGQPMRVAAGRLDIQRLMKIDSSDVLPVDLLLPIDDALAVLLQDRTALTVEAQPIWVIGLQSLRALKGLRGSALDRADLEALGTDEPVTPSDTPTLRRIAALRNLCLALPHIPTPAEERLLARFREVTDSPEDATPEDVQAIAIGLRQLWCANDIDRLLSVASGLPRELTSLNREVTTHLMAARVHRWGEQQERIERCRVCKDLRPDQVDLPLSRGEIPPPPLTIRILFVGVAPTRLEGRSRGTHFYSSRNDLLRTGLFRALDASPFATRLVESNRRSTENGNCAFHRAGFFFVHAAKIHPTQEDAPPTAVLTACAVEHLGAEIQLLQPQAICFLGNTPGHLPAVARALFGRRITHGPERAVLGSWNGFVAVTAQPRRRGVRRAGHTLRSLWRFLESGQTVAES